MKFLNGNYEWKTNHLSNIVGNMEIHKINTKYYGLDAATYMGI